MSQREGTHVSHGSHRSHGSSTESRRGKYGGILKRSQYKEVRDRMFSFFDYVFTNGPPHETLVNVFQMISITQAFMACLMQFDRRVWPPDTVLGRIIAVLSCVGVIYPTNLSPVAFLSLLLIVEAFLFVSVGLMLLCSYFFWRHAKVSQGIAFFVSSGMSTAAPWMMTSQTAAVTSCLVMIVHGQYVGTSCIALVVGLIFCLGDVMMYKKFVGPRLSFRFSIYNMYDSRARDVHAWSLMLIMVITTVASMFEQQFLMFISVIPLGSLFWLTEKDYVWGSFFMLTATKALCVTGSIAVVLLPTLVWMDSGNYEIAVVALIIMMFIMKGVFSKLQTRRIRIVRENLAEHENISTAEEVAAIPYGQLRNMLRVGFELGNPLCHTWKLFELAVQVYPADKDLLVMYAMYASIYPDETVTLISVAVKLNALKHGDDSVKNILCQINSVLQHRERGRLKSLEKSLAKIKGRIERCRNQIRYIWECIITGNVGELEGLGEQLRHNQEDIMTDYNHLMCIYPNNPHVVRSYASFLVDILCAEDEANKMQRMYRLLLGGMRSKMEHNYHCALQRFRNLPSEREHSIMTKPDIVTVQDQGISSFSAYSTFEKLAEFKGDQISSGRRYIESMIENIRLPVLQYGPVMIVVFMCVLAPVLAILAISFMTEHIAYVGRVVQSIETLARLEINTLQVMYHTFQYVFSEKGYIPTMEERFEIMYDASIPKFENFERRYYMEDDRIAMLRCAAEVGTGMNDFNRDLADIVATEYFNDTRVALLTNSIFFYNYIDGKTRLTWKIPIEHMISLAATTAVQIANTKAGYDLFEYPGFWNSLRNCGNSIQDMDLMLTGMVAQARTYFDESTVRLRNMFAGGIVVSCLVELAIVVILWTQLQRQKSIVFASFRALPKSALSTMIRRRKAKGNDDASDDWGASSPEEDALRLLSTTDSDKRGSGKRRIKFVIVATLEITFSIILLIWIYAAPLANVRAIYGYAPLYRDLAAVHSKIMASYLILQRMSMSSEPYLLANYPELTVVFGSGEVLVDYATPVKAAETLLMQVLDDIRAFRFGDSDKGYDGIAAMDSHLVELLSYTETDPFRIPENIFEVLSMTSYDTSTSYIVRKMLIMIISTLYTDPPNFERFAVNAAEFDTLSVWILSVSHRKFTLPLLDGLHESALVKIAESKGIGLIIPVVVSCLVIVICGCVFIPLFLDYGSIASWIPRLLLFCDPAVVLQSKAIVKILSNDYTTESEDIRNDTRFYEVLSTNIPNGIIFMSNDLTIHSVNDAISSIIGKSPDEVIGKSMKALFDPPPGQDTGVRTFIQSVDDALHKLRSPKIDDQFVVLRNGGIATLNVSMNAITSSGEVQVKPTHGASLVLLTLSIRDVTATVQAREALEREHRKNEELMTIVLPIQIVQGLQKGDREISYVASNVTIGYVNIVQFTPWCENQDPSYIMSIVNRLINTYDEIRGRYPNITKVKAIGDMYICAGGIFESKNRSQSGHAHEVVSFCLDVINSVRNMNRELEENISVRCGCNTGGPIVAGVSGTVKPCFDVIGLAMDIAQVMERTGPPNQVHISESVYSLIFSQDFVVKEDADVEDNGKVYHTYLVSGLDKVT